MTRGWHFQHIVEWVPAFGIRYHVAVDGVSMWLILLSTLHHADRRLRGLRLAQDADQGSVLRVPAPARRDDRRVRLARSVPVLRVLGADAGPDGRHDRRLGRHREDQGGVQVLPLHDGRQHADAGRDPVLGLELHEARGLPELRLPRAAARGLARTRAAWLCFFGFFLAFAIKVPMFPFHTWLPDAHVQAPTGGSIILAAVLLKLGTYGYIRFCMGLLGGVAWMSAATLAGFAIGGGIVYGALVAWKQDDVKRLVAYSSVAHMGFVMLGLFAGTQSGMEGAVLQMLNHGVSTGALFLLVGVIYDRRHTRLVAEFGGLAKVMPIYAALFVIVTMSSIGVPGTNGFVGEFMIIMGTFVSQTLGGQAKLQAGLASAGVILAAVYMLSVVQQMFFGPLTNPKNKHLTDMNVRETVAIAPLLALIFVIGLFPNLFLSRMSDGVAAVLERYKESREAYLELGTSDTAKLTDRHGGPLEQGYPEAPSKKADAPAPSKLKR